MRFRRLIHFWSRRPLEKVQFGHFGTSSISQPGVAPVCVFHSFHRRPPLRSSTVHSPSDSPRDPLLFCCFSLCSPFLTASTQRPRVCFHFASFDRLWHSFSLFLFLVELLDYFCVGLFVDAFMMPVHRCRVRPGNQFTVCQPAEVVKNLSHPLCCFTRESERVEEREREKERVGGLGLVVGRVSQCLHEDILHLLIPRKGSMQKYVGGGNNVHAFAFSCSAQKNVCL